MRRRLTEFVQLLRADGVRISVAETLDAMAAVDAVGLEPDRLREALAASLVKDELDRHHFDAAFDSFFAAPAAPAQSRGRRGPGPGAAEEGGRSGGGRGGGGASTTARATPPSPSPSPVSPKVTAARPQAARDREAPPPQSAAQRSASESARAARRAGEREKAGERPLREGTQHAAGSRRLERPDEPERRRGTGGTDPRDLLRQPIDSLTPSELDAARALALELGRRFAARAARRWRRRKSGRIDIRRTIRGALGRGGAMIVLERRGRRPGKPNLLVLCDVSGSVSRNSELLLALLLAGEAAFRRVSRFVFVDHLVPAALEGGHLVPEQELDFHARSDFGQVLCELEARPATPIDRATVILVLGDARNNRLPARADVLKRLRSRARAVIWAVAEARARWNTGDSALAAYASACDLVLETTSLRGLSLAVREAARR